MGMVQSFELAWLLVLGVVFRSDEAAVGSASSHVLSSLRIAEVNSVMSAYEDAFSLCRTLFQWDRWNCPMPKKIQDAKVPVSLTSSLPDANRETAFLHSLVSASIVYHMIEDCHNGKNPSCPCLSLAKTPSESAVKSECSQDLLHGFKRGQRAIKLLELKNVDGERRLFNQKNTNAGYQALKESLITVCRCSGVTRSCTSKTCWKSSPVSMKVVGTRLKNVYRRAKKVVVRNGTLYESSTRNASCSVRKVENPMKNDSVMVYLKDSPKYCTQDLNSGFTGTLGRECQSENMQACADLCDICGYRTHMFKEKFVDHKCRCRFQWCCQVVCQSCEKHVMKANCVLKT